MAEVASEEVLDVALPPTLQNATFAHFALGATFAVFDFVCTRLSPGLTS